MGGGRGRTAYAYRDLDEEVFYPRADHDYQSQESPVPECNAQCAPQKSESAILRSHFNKTRSKRRRVLFAAGTLLLVGSSALLIAAKSMEPPQFKSALELAISAPYGALRGSGDVKASRNTPYKGELDTLELPSANSPNVGDPDPNDDRVLNDGTTMGLDELGMASKEEDFYSYEGEDRWNGPNGFIDNEKEAAAEPPNSA
ncbi:hypothetical protein FI667_g11532, partial [Globisporangium splendens]